LTGFLEKKSILWNDDVLAGGRAGVVRWHRWAAAQVYLLVKLLSFLYPSIDCFHIWTDA